MLKAYLLLDHCYQNWEHNFNLKSFIIYECNFSKCYNFSMLIQANDKRPINIKSYAIRA